MEILMDDITKLHKYTSDQKLKWFGMGEWVEEPDFAYFKHCGYTCRVKRIIKYETTDECFGGHLCGYVDLPEDHPWFGKGYDDIEVEIHGGLTYAEPRKSDDEDNLYTIGFDCAHYGDLLPSILKLKKSGVLSELYNDFTEIYKNFNYAIEECKSLAEQAEKATKPL
jgi:hypothetical protein